MWERERGLLSNVAAGLDSYTYKVHLSVDWFFRMLGDWEERDHIRNNKAQSMLVYWLPIRSTDSSIQWSAKISAVFQRWNHPTVAAPFRGPFSHPRSSTPRFVNPCSSNVIKRDSKQSFRPAVAASIGEAWRESEEDFSYLDLSELTFDFQLPLSLFFSLFNLCVMMTVCHGR